MQLKLGCLITCILLQSASVFAQCAYAEIVYPSGGKLTEIQPELRWRAVPGAAHYRMQLQVREPEGGTLWSLDTAIAGTAYRLPRPLTRTTAVVKTLVSTGCPHLKQEDLEAQPAAFYVDVTAMCPSLTGVNHNPLTREIRWNTAREHKTVEAAAYHMTDGRLLERHSASAGTVALKTRESSVLALRPQCSESDGQVYFVPISAAGS